MRDLHDLRAWVGLCDICYFGGGSPPPPPLIIPPPPPPPPVLPDLGSQQKLEEERAKLAAQLSTGRARTDLTGADDELRARKTGLGGVEAPKPGRFGSGGSGGGVPTVVGNPGAPAYTGSILGAIGERRLP